MDRLRSLGALLSRALGKGGAVGDIESPDRAAPRPGSPYRAAAAAEVSEPRLVHETSEWISSLVADDLGLYVVEGARILEIALGGSLPRVIASLGAWPACVALDEANVYWAERARPLGQPGDEGPWRVPRRSGAAERVALRDSVVREGGAHTVDVTDISARGGVVHWVEHEHEDVDEGKPYRRTIGCRVLQAVDQEALELCSRPRPIEKLFIEDDSLFWIERGPGWETWLMSMPRSAGAATERWRLRDRAPHRDAARSELVFDGERFVWSDGCSFALLAARRDGAITRIPCDAYPLAIAAERGRIVALIGRLPRVERTIVRVRPETGVVEPLARFEVDGVDPAPGLLAIGGGSVYFGTRKRLWEIEIGA